MIHDRDQFCVTKLRKVSHFTVSNIPKMAMLNSVVGQMLTIFSHFQVDLNRFFRDLQLPQDIIRV